MNKLNITEFAGIRIDLKGNGVCKKHGKYLDFGYGCHKCLVDAQIERDKAIEISELDARLRLERQSKVETLLANASIPKIFQNAMVNDFRGLVKSQLRNYVLSFQDSPKNAIFYGGVGVGKTHGAYALIKAIINNYAMSADIVSVLKLDMIIRESKSFAADVKEHELINYLSNLDLLVIDEVGIQSGSNAEHNNLFNIINARHEAGKPIVVISNLDIDALKNCIGDRMYSRLMKSALTVKFAGQDRRLNDAN